MSLQALVNTADCGPSTALQGLSKQFERDRGAQQDIFGAGRAGPLREGFRSQQAPVAQEQINEAAQFFGRAGPPAVAPQQAFDVRALREALATVPQAPVASWAADFLAGTPATSVVGPLRNEPHAAAVQQQQQQQQHQSHTLPLQFQQPLLAPRYLLPQQRDVAGKGKARADLWEREFQTLTTRHEEQTKTAQRDVTVDSDDLARTAGLLLDAVSNDTSDKFRQSEFLGFMRRLRDRELVVDGDAVVERADASSSSQAGSGFAARAPPLAGSVVGGIHWQGQAAATAAASGSGSAAVQVVDEESELDRYLARENAEYKQFWDNAAREQAQARAPRESWRDPQSAQWDALQRDWDAFEATAAGVRPVSIYSFQSDNPYLRGETSRAAMRYHELLVPSASDVQAANYASILENEARVQHDPLNAQAWYELGVHQQESERDYKAVQALSRAVELQPSLLPAWIALAVSHSNEGRRESAYAALEEWARRSTMGTNIGGSASLQERHERLVNTLLDVVRAAPEGRIDADIQIALAVLFHTAEDYSKALDCFRTALAVRPDDALLYNRIGATLANSGRSEDALPYYHRALELAPAYVRARFNTGIALINMNRLEEGARHLFDALVLQKTDGTMHDAAGEPSAVTNSQMWDLLKSASIRMNRIDLVGFCDRRDLEGFRASFNGPQDI